jgi:hypothetical protein
MTTLADLGNWPSTKIGTHGVVRHAYENVLTACARLASFATGNPTTTDGPIDEQQEILAVDDLATFALHARRLIENTATAGRFREVRVRRFPLKALIASYEMPIYRAASTGQISITKVINVIIHLKSLRIVRSAFETELLVRRYALVEVYSRYGDDNDQYFSPIVFVQSHKNQTVAFEIKELIETFQAKVLGPIIELCGEQRLHLDMDWLRL